MNDITACFAFLKPWISGSLPLKKESFESLRLPLDKISCTRQFESKLSLRSFAKSLAKGSFFENLPVLPYP